MNKRKTPCCAVPLKRTDPGSSAPAQTAWRRPSASRALSPNRDQRCPEARGCSARLPSSGHRPVVDRPGWARAPGSGRGRGRGREAEGPAGACPRDRPPAACSPPSRRRCRRLSRGNSRRASHSLLSASPSFFSSQCHRAGAPAAAATTAGGTMVRRAYQPGGRGPGRGEPPALQGLGVRPPF